MKRDELIALLAELPEDAEIAVYKEEVGMYFTDLCVCPEKAMPEDITDHPEEGYPEGKLVTLMVLQ